MCLTKRYVFGSSDAGATQSPPRALDGQGAAPAGARGAGRRAVALMTEDAAALPVGAVPLPGVVSCDEEEEERAALRAATGTVTLGTFLAAVVGSRPDLPASWSWEPWAASPVPCRWRKTSLLCARRGTREVMWWWAGQLDLGWSMLALS